MDRSFIRTDRIGDRCETASGSSARRDRPGDVAIRKARRVLNVLRELSLERVDPGVLLLLAEPVDQLDANRATVEIAIEADQVRLDLKGVVAERRHRPH